MAEQKSPASKSLDETLKELDKSVTKIENNVSTGTNAVGVATSHSSSARPKDPLSTEPDTRDAKPSPPVPVPHRVTENQKIEHTKIPEEFLVRDPELGKKPEPAGLDARVEAARRFNETLNARITKADIPVGIVMQTKDERLKDILKRNGGDSQQQLKAFAEIKELYGV